MHCILISSFYKGKMREISVFHLYTAESRLKRPQIKKSKRIDHNYFWILSLKHVWHAGIGEVRGQWEHEGKKYFEMIFSENFLSLTLDA